MTLKPNRRGQYYIQRSFQRRFILQFVGLVIIGCVVFGLLLYGYSTTTLTTAFVHSRLRVMSTADFLLPALGFTTLIVSALVAIACGARLLFFSHRIAGPLYRLERTARAIGDGDLSLPIRLRSRDELQEFAKAMDGMVSDLRTHLGQIKEQSQQLGELLGRANDHELPREMVGRLREVHRRLNESIERFRM